MFVCDKFRRLIPYCHLCCTSKARGSEFHTDTANVGVVATTFPAVNALHFILCKSGCHGTVVRVQCAVLRQQNYLRSSKTAVNERNFTCKAFFVCILHTIIRHFLFKIKKKGIPTTDASLLLFKYT